jgi:flagellar protein FliL
MHELCQVFRIMNLAGITAGLRFEKSGDRVPSIHHREMHMVGFKKKKKEAAEGAEDKEKDEKDTKATEGAEGAEGAEGEAAPKKSKKKLFIIIGAVVLLLGGGAGVYFSGVLGKGEAATAEGEASEEGHGGGHGEGGATAASVYFDLPEFLVNLNTNSRQSSFLKMTVVLELASEQDQKAIEAALPRVQDVFNTYLRELRAADLYGSAGIYRLREELLSRINKAVAPVQVKDILFKQVLIQ